MSARAVVLASGRGSNLRAILEFPPLRGKVSAVFSDNPDAAALEVAREAGVFAECVNPRKFSGRVAFEAALAEAVERRTPKAVALAGFMRILSAEFVARFRGRLVNIHPSLLPDFPGLETHRRALEAGATSHGCTAHWVDAEVDAGPVIRQARVEVLKDDSAETLAARALAEEHRIYPAVIADILAGRIRRETTGADSQ